MSALGPDTLATALWALAAFALGIGLGALHFLSLKVGVRLLAEGRLVAPLALLPLRFIVLAAVLFFVATRGGAIPLIAATLGLLAARALILKRERADG